MFLMWNELHATRIHIIVESVKVKRKKNISDKFISASRKTTDCFEIISLFMKKLVGKYFI